MTEVPPTEITVQVSCVKYEVIFALYILTQLKHKIIGEKYHFFRAKGFQSTEIFEGIAEALKEDGANLVKKVKGIFGFKVKDTNGNEVLWIVDAKNGSGKVELNGSGKFKYGKKTLEFYF